MLEDNDGLSAVPQDGELGWSDKRHARWRSVAVSNHLTLPCAPSRSRLAHKIKGRNSIERSHNPSLAAIWNVASPQLSMSRRDAPYCKRTGITPSSRSINSV